jgi:nicotinamidase/pyrazinamidase
VSGRAILWDVDTQVDFMLPEGKLYVPGAEQTREAMGRLVQGARAAGIVHVASADDHELTDPELTDEPDFETTYPPHCLRGTHGAAKIPETEQVDPLPLGATPYPPGLLRRLVDGRREILLLKKSYSVFANPSAAPLLDLLDPAEIVVFGVATDVCDHAAIMGMLDRGRQVAFVEDAARGLSEALVESCTELWRQRGVRFTTSDDVLAGW